MHHHSPLLELSKILLILIQISIISSAPDLDFIQLNFLVVPESTSVQYQITLDTSNLNVSFNINSDKNLVYGPKSKSIRRHCQRIQEVDIKTPRNILFSNITSYKINKPFTITDSNHKKITLTLPINYIEDPKMKSISDPHSPMTHIGLARIFKKEENSIIHYLYKEKIINKMQFSLEYNYPHWGVLKIGKDDMDIVNKGVNVSSVRCINTQNAIINSNWGIYLDGIFIGDERTKISKKNAYNGYEYSIDPIKSRALELKMPVYLNTEYENIVVPFEVLQYFENNYFTKYLKDRNCRMEEDVDKIFFRCRKSIIEEMETINFIFDDNVDLFVKGKDLFDKKGRFKIVYLKNYRREFIFGYFFMKNFKIIFDYDKDNVSFYSGSNKVFIEKFAYPNSIFVSTEYENVAYVNRIYSDYYGDIEYEERVKKHGIIKRLLGINISIILLILLIFMIKFIRNLERKKLTKKKKKLNIGESII